MNASSVPYNSSVLVTGDSHYLKSPGGVITQSGLLTERIGSTFFAPVRIPTYHLTLSGMTPGTEAYTSPKDPTRMAEEDTAARPYPVIRSLLIRSDDRSPRSFVS